MSMTIASPTALSLQAARRGRGWDVATLAREASVPVDVVVRAELGEAVAPECLASVCGVLDVDPVHRPLPVVPVDARHGRDLRRLEEMVREDGAMLAAPDVAALSEAGGWSLDDLQRLERRSDTLRMGGVIAVAVSGVAFVADLVTGLSLSPTFWLAHHDLVHAMTLGLAPLGGMAFAGAVVGLAAEAFPGRRLDRLRGLYWSRKGASDVGYLVKDDALTVVKVGRASVTRVEHRRADVRAVSATADSPDHVTLTVFTREGQVVMPWLLRDDPVVAALLSWSRDRP